MRDKCVSFQNFARRVEGVDRCKLRSIMIQFMMCLIMPFFTGEKYTPDSITGQTTCDQKSFNTIKRFRSLSCDADSSLYISDFTCVEGISGFVVNACGIVADFSAIVPTRNGGVMSSFQLRDVKGRCIQCMAIGRHAGSVLLQKGNEVVIFFAQATKSLSASRNGHLSVYDESHISLLRSKVPVPHARQEMQIRD